MRKKYKVDENDFVNFGDIARGELGQQCQYASRYILGILDYPHLGEGLRFQNVKPDGDNYHSYRIHISDVLEFVRRVKQYNEDRLAGKVK